MKKKKSFLPYFYDHRINERIKGYKAEHEKAKQTTFTEEQRRQIRDMLYKTGSKKDDYLLSCERLKLIKTLKLLCLS